MNNEIKLPIRGDIEFVLRGPDGQIKDKWEIRNTITTAGKTALATWLATGTQSTKFMPYIGIGEGTTGAAVGDTALESELVRQAGTITSATNVYTNTTTFAAGTGTGAVTEAGLLSASESGTLFARQVFTAKNKGALDTLDVTWNITLG